MVQYLKARLYSETRGTLSGEVLIFKLRSALGHARFLLVSNRQIAASWNRNEADGDITVPVYQASGEDVDIHVRGEGFYHYVTLPINQDYPEWMSITSFCSLLDLDAQAELRHTHFGENAVDPGRILSFDPGNPLVIGEAFVPAVSPSRTADSPAVARTSAESVAILEGYTRTDIYSGFSSYHHNQHAHRFNTPIVADRPWRIGIELEVYARSREAYNTITSARSNWFQCESDGSLREATYPIEIKTIPLRACDAKSVEFWDAPMRRLAQLAKSKEYRSTGLHVHIGKEILGDNERERTETLNKLCWFYVYRIENVPDAHAKNVAMAGREQGYAGSLDASKAELADFAELVGYKAACGNKNAFDKMASQVRQKTASQRWDINLQHLNDYGTVEFRKGDGRISKTRLAGLVTWWEQMVLYCRTHSQDQLDFDEFFAAVCAEYPAVAYFFTRDEEV